MESNKSKHFLIYFQPNSTAQKELSHIIELLENGYEKITEELNIKIRPKITCYLYQTQKAKLLATGESANAHTNRDKFEFFAVYNSQIKAIGCHEIVHLFTNHFGLPNYIFNEGLAEYFETNWTAMLNHKLTTMPHNKWVLNFIENDTYIPIVKLFDDNKFWELDPIGAISYPEAGSFIKFLADRYGIDKIMLAYQQLKRKADVSLSIKTFKKIFNADLADIEKEWLTYLAN